MFMYCISLSIISNVEKERGEEIERKGPIRGTDQSMGQTILYALKTYKLPHG